MGSPQLSSGKNGWLAVLVLFVVPTLDYSAPSVLSKGWGGYISLRFAWIPTSRASIRIGRSPRRGRNNLERQPHDGEPVADGNVLPRNTRTTMASWMEEPAAPHACRSVSLLLFLSFPPSYFGWAFMGQIGNRTAADPAQQNWRPESRSSRPQSAYH